jgi:hypothetical protein
MFLQAVHPYVKINYTEGKNEKNYYRFSFGTFSVSKLFCIDCELLFKQ